MSRTTDKLSASVRKAKAQSAGEKPPAAAPAQKPAASKAPAPAKRAAKSKATPRSAAPRAAAKPRVAATKVATGQTPAASHGELFPTRVWPD